MNATIPSASSSSIPQSSATTTTKTTKSPQTKTTSSHQATSTTASPAPALTTGAKVGIGVGVAGGVCLIAALAIVFFFFRRRKSQDQTQNASQYNSPEDKSSAWQGQPYPPGGSPHGYHYSQSYPYQGVPAVVHEASYSPADAQTIRKHMSPPPVEMQAEHDVPEMESRTTGVAK